MKALKNIYKNKGIQVFKDRRSDLIIEPMKFYFQGLAYFTGVSIQTPTESIIIEPTPGKQFIIKSTSKLRKTEFFLKFSEVVLYLNKEF